MDLVLDFCDKYALDAAWAYLLPARLPVDEFYSPNATLSKLSASPAASYIRAAATAVLSDPSAPSQEWVTVSAWERDDWRRQFVSLCAITLVGINLMYFVVAGLSYRYLFDHRMMQHPRYLKNQVRLEIQSSLATFGPLTLLTVPWFLGEARGWSLCYDSIADSPLGGGIGGYAYLAFSCAFFLWFTDLAIYFVHRWEHLPSVYKRIHKPHHRWIIPTPFASHAFHPLDGYAQSLPYHVFIYMFPLHKMAYIILFGLVNLWTIFIHDSDMIVDHPLEKVINGPAHHTLHHLYFTCNYGQYFTWADRTWGSYRHPAKGDDPLLVVLERQTKNREARDAVNAARQEAEMQAALEKAEQGDDKKTQ